MKYKKEDFKVYSFIQFGEGVLCGDFWVEQDLEFKGMTLISDMKFIYINPHYDQLVISVLDFDDWWYYITETDDEKLLVYTEKDKCKKKKELETIEKCFEYIKKISEE